MDLSGKQIGRYRIERKIGKGGSATIYMAVDTQSGKQVALKVLEPHHNYDEQKVKRFWRSAQGHTKLRHAHIVPIYDVGIADGHYYIAMQYIQGGSVADLLEQKGKLPPALAVRIASQVASALDFAHGRGVVHRDMKPSNILLSTDGQTAYLADFGIAQVTGQETITDFGKLNGTPEYMAPEQILGQQIDGRCDIYSLGITLYKMLTGTLPFTGEPTSVLYHQVNQMPAPLRTHAREISPGLERAVTQALAKSPGQRPGTAKAYAIQLQQALSTRPEQGKLIAAIGLVAILVVVLFQMMGARNREDGISVVPTPDSTPTPVVKPEITETLPASATLAPTRPQTEEATSTIEATSTPMKETKTPVATRAAESTATAQSTQAAIRVSYPAAGATLRGGDHTFRWQWNGTLASNQHFEIRFYAEDSDQPIPIGGWSKEPYRTINMFQLDKGTYQWQVFLVQGNNGNWEKDVAQSAKHSLMWEGS